ncbi:17152_t:CDS:1, partial [Gigaspora margarita]
VNKKQSKEVYTYLNSNLHLSDYHTFARKTLNIVLDNIALYVINQAKTSEYEVTIAFNRWTNVVNQYFIESILVKNNGEPLIWDVVDISGHCKRTEKIMEYTKNIFNNIKKEQIVVIELATD